MVDGIPLLFGDGLEAKYRKGNAEAQRYYRGVASDYETRHGVNQPGAQHFLRQLKERLQPYLKGAPTILEIGAGTGFLSRAILDLHDDLVVTDASFEMLRLNHLEHPRLAAICCPAEKLPFAGDSFDLVVGNNAFYMVPDKDACARQVAHVLKKNGRFVISDVNPHQPLWPLRLLFSGRWFERGIYRLFPWQMKRCFAQARMEVEEVDYFAFTPYFVGDDGLGFFSWIERTFGRWKLLRRFVAFRIFYVVKKI